MTVCTASLFFWFYGENDIGPAIIGASDRMLTDEGLGIEYESSRFKGSLVNKTNLVLVAGSIVVHSAVLQKLSQHLSGHPDLKTREIAELFSAELREYKNQQAEKMFLSPLGLTMESFQEKQQLLDASLVGDIRAQLQQFSVDAEAIVAGCQDKEAHIYHVNQDGVVTCHDDIGFLSIGLGGIHASAQFMLEPYSHVRNYYAALYSTFCAKKRAEVAPGVGKHTDMLFINRNGVTEVDRKVIDKLEKIYEQHKRATKKMLTRVESQIVGHEKRLFPSAPTETSSSPP